MSVDTDLKAGLILEDLSQQLSDAVVDYQFAGGNHELRIHCGDVVYQVDFPERVLLEHQIRDLEKIIPQIVDRLVAVGGPRQITFGKDGVGPNLALPPLTVRSRSVPSLRLVDRPGRTTERSIAVP